MRVSVFCLFPIDVACLWLGALRGLRAYPFLMDSQIGSNFLFEHVFFPKTGIHFWETCSRAHQCCSTAFLTETLIFRGRS